jgi:hypothetical protein
MKSLYNYIIEATTPKDNAEELQEKKSFSFDFSKFENAKDTVKTIVSSVEDFVSNQTETSFTLSFKKSEATQMNGVLEIIKSFLKKEAHTTKRSSDEQFAQYCSTQERIFNEFEDFVTEIPDPDDQPNVQAQKNDEEEENGDDENDENQ